MYLLFTYDGIAPRGGWHDFVGVYDTKEEAQRIANQTPDSDNWQIVDLAQRSVVAAGKARP